MTGGKGSITQAKCEFCGTVIPKARHCGTAARGTEDGRTSEAENRSSRGNLMSMDPLGPSTAAVNGFERSTAKGERPGSAESGKPVRDSRPSSAARYHPET